MTVAAKMGKGIKQKKTKTQKNSPAKEKNGAKVFKKNLKPPSGGQVIKGFESANDNVQVKKGKPLKKKVKAYNDEKEETTKGLKRKNFQKDEESNEPSPKKKKPNFNKGSTGNPSGMNHSCGIRPH